MLRTRWSLTDVRALPEGEHDYFDRKSGLLLQDSDFRADFAKAFSAFANSGGGHILLGVADDGSIDGVPRIKGRTCMREWIEQIIPNLVEPVPVAFRVHLVESTAVESIPNDGVVIVIDIDDSHFVPFQSRASKLYYHRVGGHSVPATHFFLEALRNRLRAPSFSVAISNVRILRVLETVNMFFVQLILDLDVTNNGNVTPTHWHVDLHNDGERIAASGLLRRFDFPSFTVRFPDIQRIHKDPVLPGQTRKIVEMLGVCIDRTSHEGDLPQRAVEILHNCKLSASVVSESHVGAPQILNMPPIFSAVDVPAIVYHTSHINRKSGEGALGGGIQMKRFTIESYEKPDDHAKFNGLIENSTDDYFSKLHLVVCFRDKNDNLTGYSRVNIGMLPPKSTRHWKDWIVAANVWNAENIDVFWYDESWLNS